MNKIYAISALIGLSSLSFADIQYTVTPMPAAKSVAIRMEITNPAETETVAIPAWCPGFYFLLDYEKSLFDLNVNGIDSGRIRFERLDSRTIRFKPGANKSVVLTYRIYGGDTGLGFFRTHVRSSSAFVNGPSAFMYAKDHMLEKHRMKVNLPTGWDIATAMNSNGTGIFESEGYDEFIDHPIQFGKMVRRKFTVDNIPFEAVWVGDPEPRCDVDEETERLRLGSIPAIKMFGGAPFKKYTYIVHLEVGDFAGGLEHRASTVMAVSNSRTVHLDSLATHEYFHSWNVKQIRPSILGPFDYTSPQRTGNLWFSEGVTDYYANVHAYQAGFYSTSQYLEALTNDIEQLQMGKTRLKMTVEDSSKQAWENGGFGVGDLSYYTKGLVVGLLFDATLRAESKGKRSFDDVLREAYTRYRLPNPGFPEDGLKELIAELGGEKMNALYNKMVRSVEELPYKNLEGIGLRLVVPGNEYVEPRYTLDSTQKVTNAALAKVDGGIVDGDEVLEARILTNDPEKSPTLAVKVKRGEKEIQLTVTGRRYKAGDYRLQFDPFASLEAQKRRNEWLQKPSELK